MEHTQRKTNTPLVSQAINVVLDILNRLRNNECNEEEISYILNKLNVENKGYFNEILLSITTKQCVF